MQVFRETHHCAMNICHSYTMNVNVVRDDLLSLSSNLRDPTGHSRGGKRTQGSGERRKLADSSHKYSYVHRKIQSNEHTDDFRQISKESTNSTRTGSPDL